ncbi:hypothetical protein ABZ215_33440 [Amycolatopsis sp. NPDC006131]|uniref:hypothetical protein n=1 Tax=Amycolatopsis sp. NPDC006131 TaxID=3156731 RepID=UPI0033AD1ABA
MVTKATHDRVVRIGNQLTTLGEWVVTVIAAVAAGALAAGILGTLFLVLLDLAGRH